MTKDITFKSEYYDSDQSKLYVYYDGKEIMNTVFTNCDFPRVKAIVHAVYAELLKDQVKFLTRFIPTSATPSLPQTPTPVP